MKPRLPQVSNQLLAAEFAVIAKSVPEHAILRLSALSADEQQSLRSPATQPAQKVRVGITRPIIPAVGLRAGNSLGGQNLSDVGFGVLSRTNDNLLVWSAGFESTGAAGIRLHISELQVPPGARIYFGDGQSEIHGPYIMPNGAADFWTNTTGNSRGYIFVRMNNVTQFQGAVLMVDAVAHLVRGGAPAAQASDPRKESGGDLKLQGCLLDVSCTTSQESREIATLTHAVGLLQFIEGIGVDECSGALIADRSRTETPYLITANHCFSSQRAANSLEVFWRYKTQTCGQDTDREPDPFPRSLHSRLLVTSTTTDVTLVRLLEAPPANSVFLGWSRARTDQLANQALYRVHHPNGLTQHYSRGTALLPCSDRCGKGFIYSNPVRGCTSTGSSGSPVVDRDMRIVGQLSGWCKEQSCGGGWNIDGHFAKSYQILEPWLGR